MSNAADLIRGLYQAFAAGDVPAVLAAMDPAIEWREADGVAYADGNPYVGPQAVLNGVFMRLATEWDGFAVTLEEILDAGDAVVATGTYTGKYKATGRSLRAQFAHVWKLRAGKIVGFQQYTDTAQYSAVMQASQSARV